MSTVVDRLRRLWRDHVVRPTLRTYDASCDELGGERSFDTTELVRKEPTSQTVKLALVGGLALVVIGLSLGLLVRRSAADPATVASATLESAAAIVPSRAPVPTVTPPPPAAKAKHHRFTRHHHRSSGAARRHLAPPARPL